ncbi:hypothetical protein KJ980_08885 [Patescibacteria group bacterium]|nr:hypothetical protein [Patescibacteria group bacterium]MBU4099731.1 hypothetical protein [Patescibacteria group bacterium]
MASPKEILDETVCSKTVGGVSSSSVGGRQDGHVDVSGEVFRRTSELFGRLDGEKVPKKPVGVNGEVFRKLLRNLK